MPLDLFKTMSKTQTIQAIPWWSTASALDFGDIHIKRFSTPATFAVIAVHSIRRGPALGGCRCVHYSDPDAALYDAMRLARGMSYKAAMADLALGGGKAVIMRPSEPFDRVALFEAFGEFVDSLGGRYITAVDSGTSVADMDIIARRTAHVASTSSGTGDPSSYTARGVLRGIEAAVEHRLNKPDLRAIRVAIQGVGNVGYFLTELLHKARAEITVADVNTNAIERVVSEFGVNVVSPDEITRIPCDVFAPCALGGVLTRDVVQGLRTPIVAGGANNQLAEPGIGEQLVARQILYAPDYVINAGGLIQIAVPTERERLTKIDGIRATLKSIFELSESRKVSTAAIADEMAAARIK